MRSELNSYSRSVPEKEPHSNSTRAPAAPPYPELVCLKLIAAGIDFQLAERLISRREGATGKTFARPITEGVGV